MKEILLFIGLMALAFSVTCGWEINFSPFSVRMLHPIRGVAWVLMVVAVMLFCYDSFKQGVREAYRREIEILEIRISEAETEKDVLEDEIEEAMVNFSE